MDLPKNIEFIFYHMPKCGGSSLRTMLYDKFKEIYDERQIFLPKKINVKYNFVPQYIDIIKKSDKYDYENIKVIISHIWYHSFPKEIINPKLKVSFIRNPIDRIISNYYFFHYDNTKTHMISINNFDYYIYPIFNLLGIKDTEFSIDRCNEIINEFTFIGTVENFDKDIKVVDLIINREYNTTSNMTSLKLNVNKSVPIKDKLELRRKLGQNKRVKNDLLFYKLVKNHFDTKYKDLYEQIK